MREIGSEFEWKDIPSDNCNSFCFRGVNDYAFTFSGRTSLEIILKNIPEAKKALLPSYCCKSMIEPFQNAGMDICFYRVNCNEQLAIDLRIPDDVDTLLWCNYFGYSVKMPNLYSFKQRGGIVIEDITHSFFSKEPYHLQSDFLVASIRKWLPMLCGGYCAQIKGKLEVKPTKYPPENFLKEKKSAMILKKKYLTNGDEKKKSVFMPMFSHSNAWLGDNYSNLKMDLESEQIITHVDMEYIRKCRIKNASVLHEGLKSSDLIKPLFLEQNMDCPLFVPVVIENGKRDFIQRKLIENGIFCPIHWPKPNTECKSDLYEVELSLICDQRYNEQDMQRIISVLCN